MGLLQRNVTPVIGNGLWQRQQNVMTSLMVIHKSPIQFNSFQIHSWTHLAKISFLHGPFGKISRCIITIDGSDGQQRISRTNMSAYVYESYSLMCWNSKHRNMITTFLLSLTILGGTWMLPDVKARLGIVFGVALSRVAITTLWFHRSPLV